MNTVKTKTLAPDGGYGWVIVGAYALHHLLIIPITHGFGLIYRGTFHDLNFTATQIGLILNTCSAFSMMCGIIASPLQKRLGFRKVAFMGACFVTLGIMLTSPAKTFGHFMITYGFITSFGIGLGFSSYPVALNSYFNKKRSRAVSYTLTIAGFGHVLMPQLISFLLSIYGVEGVMIILGGIAAHTFAGSLLLQPVHWHMKKVEEEIEETENNEDVTQVTEKPLVDSNISRRILSRDISREMETEAMYSMDSAYTHSMMSIAETFQRQISTKNQLSDVKIKLYDVDGNMIDDTEPFRSSECLNEKEKDQKMEKKISVPKKIRQYLVNMFDLTLLKDPIYINIMLGMSLAIFAEMNFSVLIPFIVGDYDLSTQQIATFMSTQSCADICFRFLAPYLGDCLNLPHRVLYLFSLLLLVTTRFSLLLTRNYYPLLIVAAGLGIAKGLRTVYSALVIPSHVPIERLSSALGMQMTLNGIFISVGGIVIGYIRDITGSYVKCIYVINAVTMSTFVMWSVELLYLKCKRES